MKWLTFAASAILVSAQETVNFDIVHGHDTEFTGAAVVGVIAGLLAVADYRARRNRQAPPSIRPR